MMGGKRALRTLINWAVERWFPESAFLGNGLVKMFADFRMNSENEGGIMEASVGAYLIHRAVANGAAEITVTVEKLSISGMDVGDWELIVRRKAA